MITVKKEIGVSPFELVYGTEIRVPINNLLPIYKFLKAEKLELLEPMEEKMVQMVEVEEIRTLAHKRNLNIQL